MSKTTIPSGYRMPLSNNELQRAIELIHQEFQHSLCVRLNLHRVSAPLFVDGKTGLNDDLNGVERPVTFDIPDVGTDGQVVHSLAKWKRLALKRYEFPAGTGLYTNMNAIRRDEVVDNLHSIYVDQWDWEKHITPKDRNVLYLKETVRDIVGAICDTSAALRNAFPALTFKPDRDVYFITTQELEDRFPDLTPSERETEICRKHRTVFLMQIGKTLASGQRHDGELQPAPGAALPQDAAERRTAGGHRRRHRPVPAVHATDRHLPHRRGAGQPLGPRDPAHLRRGRRHAAVKGISDTGNIRYKEPPPAAMRQAGVFRSRDGCVGTQAAITRTRQSGPRR